MVFDLPRSTADVLLSIIELVKRSIIRLSRVIDLDISEALIRFGVRDSCTPDQLWNYWESYINYHVFPVREVYE